MLPNVVRDAGRDRRARRRPVVSAPERLEGRELLAFTPLGFSLPDLTVTGQTGPIAAYGGSLAVQIDVRNLGASSILEPLNLEPGAPSTADAGATEVEVFLSPRRTFDRRAVSVGTIAVPALRQNSLTRITDTVALPAERPRGFPARAGNLFVFFRIDPDRLVPDLDRTNNLTRAGVPVQLVAPLPDLEAIALDVPPVIQPGDVIVPTIKVANFGTVDTLTQGPVSVALVASTDTDFGPGDTVLATYLISNVPPLSSVPLSRTVLGDVNIDDPTNVVELTGPIVTLPSSPFTYNLGVIVDPLNTIRELGEVRRGIDTRLNPVRRVGPGIDGLSPTVILTDPAPPGNVFPFPAFGPLDTIGNRAVTTDPIDTTGTTSAALARALRDRLAQLYANRFQTAPSPRLPQRFFGLPVTPPDVTQPGPPPQRDLRPAGTGPGDRPA